MTGPPSLTTLPPELQEMIAAYLSQHDAVQCTRVCQALSRLLTPVVWRHIQEKSWSQKKGNKASWREAFLQSCKSGALVSHGHLIHSLKLDDLDLETLLKYAPPTFPGLTSVEFVDKNRDGDGDGMITDFLGRCIGGLREVVIQVMDEWHVGFGNKSAKALLQHASTLEIVRMQGGAKFPSKAINRLLCSASNLKELYLLGSSREIYDLNGWMDVQDIVAYETEWVCTQLEVFGCKITNVPRPDMTCKIDGDSASDHVVRGTPEQSIDLQRAVYAQLGRLTKMRELTLGIAMSPNIPRWELIHYGLYDCLAMTLESGLGLMKDLKDLEIVRLEEMVVTSVATGSRRGSRRTGPRSRTSTMTSWRRTSRISRFMMQETDTVK